jgi:hypothetical protein
MHDKKVQFILSYYSTGEMISFLFDVFDSRHSGSQTNIDISFLKEPVSIILQRHIKGTQQRGPGFYQCDFYVRQQVTVQLADVLLDKVLWVVVGET